MSIISKIKRWYLGGPLPTKKRISETAETIRAPNTFELSASARIAQFLVGFWIKHWQYIVSSVIALAIYFGFIAKP